MEIRINIANKKVLEILSKIPKKDRRIFAQEAILYFHNAILEHEDVYSIVYDPVTEDIIPVDNEKPDKSNEKNKEELKIDANENNTESNVSMIDLDFELNFD